MKRPNCKKCCSELTNRIKRESFFQRVIMFKLGRFPWECSKCRVVFYSKERGVKKVRSNGAESSGRSVVPSS